MEKPAQRVNPSTAAEGRTVRGDQVVGRASPFIETDIPARLDRLPWSRFHWLVVVALGVTWILDGLEVTLAGSVAAALQESPTLRFGSTEIGTGAVLGLFILFLRRFVPESPRWLMIHGRIVEANEIIAEIEQRVATATDIALPPAEGRLRISGRGHAGLAAVLRTLFTTHRPRTVLGVVLITAQAFFYNAIFFTYALILTRFYDVPSYNVGWYILPFALGNVLGPLLLGPLFDSIGRKPMIAFTYAVSGLLLAGSGWLFANHLLDATQQTIIWTVIFFFASSAAGAAYLTASEIFPVDIRAL